MKSKKYHLKEGGCGLDQEKEHYRSLWLSIVSTARQNRDNYRYLLVFDQDMVNKKFTSFLKTDILIKYGVLVNSKSGKDDIQFLCFAPGEMSRLLILDEKKDSVFARIVLPLQEN